MGKATRPPARTALFSGSRTVYNRLWGAQPLAARSPKCRPSIQMVSIDLLEILPAGQFSIPFLLVAPIPSSSDHPSSLPLSGSAGRGSLLKEPGPSLGAPSAFPQEPKTPSAPVLYRGSGCWCCAWQASEGASWPR